MASCSGVRDSGRSPAQDEPRPWDLKPAAQGFRNDRQSLRELGRSDIFPKSPRPQMMSRFLKLIPAIKTEVTIMHLIKGGPRRAIRP